MQSERARKIERERIIQFGGEATTDHPKGEGLG